MSGEGDIAASFHGFIRRGHVGVKFDFHASVTVKIFAIVISFLSDNDAVLLFSVVRSSKGALADTIFNEFIKRKRNIPSLSVMRKSHYHFFKHFFDFQYLPLYPNLEAYELESRTNIVNRVYLMNSQIVFFNPHSPVCSGDILRLKHVDRVNASDVKITTIWRRSNCCYSFLRDVQYVTSSTSSDQATMHETSGFASPHKWNYVADSVQLMNVSAKKYIQDMSLLEGVSQYYEEDGIDEMDRQAGQRRVFQPDIPYISKPQPLQSTRFLSLQDCCEYGLVETLQHLINTNADIDGVDSQGYTPLFKACSSRNIRVIQLLLSHKAKVDKKCVNGETALHITKGWSCYSLVCKPLNDEFNTSIRTNNCDGIKRLLSIGMVDDGDGNNILVQACHYSSDKIVSLILSHKVDVNSQNCDGSTALMWAAFMGRDTVIRWLLNHDADLSLKDVYGWTAVIYAEVESQEKIISLLASKNLTTEYDKKRSMCDAGIHEKFGCAINKYSKFTNCMENAGASILLNVAPLSDVEKVLEKLFDYFQKYSVCTSEISELIEYIARHGTSAINKRHASLDSFLHVVCKLNLYDAVYKLLRNPYIQVNLRDGNLRTPITLVAMSHQNSDMVTLLLHRGATVVDIDHTELSALDYAAKLLNRELLQKFFHAYPQASISRNILERLCDHYMVERESEARTSERLDLLKEYFTNGRYSVDGFINHHNDTIQIYCCRYSLTAFVFLTIQFGANSESVNVFGETALLLSVEKPWWSRISELPYKKLWMALEHNNIIEIQRLVRAGVCLNLCNTNGEFALVTAVLFSSDEVVSELLSLGADVNVSTNGVTPLLAAASKGSTNKLLMLMDYHANLNALDNDKNSFLHLLAQGGYLEALTMGVKRAMEISLSILQELLNARNNIGWTPIMVAADRLSEECSDFLSAAGSKAFDFDFLDRRALSAEIVATSKVKTNPCTLSDSQIDPLIALPSVESLIATVLRRTMFERLYHACKLGLTPIVKYLVKSENTLRLAVNRKVSYSQIVMGKDKLIKRMFSETCLFVACLNGHIEVVSILLEIGADPNSVAKNGWSCLFAASRNGHTSIVKKLLCHKADAHAVNLCEMTPLSVATYRGHLDIVKLLVDYHSNVNHRDKKGVLPLHAAVKSGNVDMVEYLLLRGADINALSDSEIGPLNFASSLGNLSIVKLFLSYQPSQEFPLLRKVDINAMNNDGFTSLTVAAINGHLAIVEALLDAGADINKTEKKMITALYAACRRGFFELAALLLSRGADPNVGENKDTAVHAAVSGNRSDILRLLLTYKAKLDEPDAKGYTPLYIACEKNHVEILIELIKNGARVNTHCKDLVSPLNIAAQNGHLKVVEMLINYHANINSQTENGPTALFTAAQNGHTDICRLLLRAGAEKDIQNKEKESAILVAGYDGHVEIVKLLIDFNASLNFTNRDNRTPLWWAAKAGHLQVVQMYINARAELNTEDNNLVTPLMAAAENGRPAVVSLLRVAGAKASKCKICSTNERCLLFTSCNHVACCFDCGKGNAMNQQLKHCPICRRGGEFVSLWT